MHLSAHMVGEWHATYRMPAVQTNLDNLDNQKFVRLSRPVRVLRVSYPFQTVKLSRAL